MLQKEDYLFLRWKSTYQCTYMFQSSQRFLSGSVMHTRAYKGPCAFALPAFILAHNSQLDSEVQQRLDLFVLHDILRVPCTLSCVCLTNGGKDSGACRWLALPHQSRSSAGHRGRPDLASRGKRNGHTGRSRCFCHRHLGRSQTCRTGFV
jgi:hypothetical protein